MTRFTLSRLTRYRNRIRGGPDKLIVIGASTSPNFTQFNQFTRLTRLTLFSNPYTKK